jgi:hypothetical protein
MVTASDVMNYRPDHFRNGAEWFANTSQQWGDAGQTQRTDARNLEWRGLAGTAYQAVSDADHTEVDAATAQAAAAAATLTTHGTTVWEATTNAQFWLTEADRMDFDVDNSTFQVTDRNPASSDPEVQAARQAQASMLASNIGTSVTALLAADNAAAAAVRAATDFSRYHQTTNGHIMAAGHGYKTDSNGADGTIHPHDLAELMGNTDNQRSALEQLLLPPGAPPGSAPDPSRVQAFWTSIANQTAALPDVPPEIRRLQDAQYRNQISSRVCSGNDWFDKTVGWFTSVGGTALAGAKAASAGPMAAVGAMALPLAGVGTSTHLLWQCVERQMDYASAMADLNANAHAPFPVPPAKAGY